MKALRCVFKVLLSLGLIFLVFWFTLPPLNVKSVSFWSFIIVSIIIFIAVSAFSKIISSINAAKSGATVEQINFKGFAKPVKYAIYLIGAMIILGVLASTVGSQIFNADKYNKLLTLEDGDFTKDVSEISLTQIPVVDRDTAVRLGQRKLGEMSDLVSQFEIAGDYTQVNYKNKPVRVTPLNYGDILKWFNNRSKGIPAYIMVDMVTQETKLVKLEHGIKYSNSEYFMRNINRYLRFKFPTKIIDKVSFEIDESGVPYWVAATVSYKIGYWSGNDIDGAILVNAITGESKFYELNEIPKWVDRVFNSELILQQLIYNGKYRSGFWNSTFGQRGVLQPTEGYNYLAINDDVWLYTGMTSVSSDQSNVGFVLINLRTKQSMFYTVPGAEEYSAMSSAQGQVQDLKYVSTFPILLNVSNRPTYFMSLKDNAGLVKMYAFVDVEQYQIVGTGVNVRKALDDYIDRLSSENADIIAPEETIKTGVVSGISSAVVEGNTIYFITIENDDNVYVVPISLSNNLVFLKAGDTVNLKLNTINDNVTVKEIEIIK